MLSVPTAPCSLCSESKAQATPITPTLDPPVSNAETHVNRGRTVGDNAPTLSFLKMYSRFTCNARPTELAMLLRLGLRGYRRSKEEIHCRFSPSVQHGSTVWVTADKTRQGTDNQPVDCRHYKRSTSSHAVDTTVSEVHDLSSPFLCLTLAVHLSHPEEVLRMGWLVPFVRAPAFNTAWGLARNKRYGPNNPRGSSKMPLPLG